MLLELAGRRFLPVDDAGIRRSENISSIKYIKKIVAILMDEIVKYDIMI